LAIIVGGASGTVLSAGVLLSLRWTEDASVVAESHVEASWGGVITGRVTEARSARPVAAAQVYIGALQIGVLTQEDGSFVLDNLPAGRHTVTVERIGYREVSASVGPSGGGGATLDFRVFEEAVLLDELIVTGEAAVGLQPEAR
jgi:hypothetical protein